MKNLITLTMALVFAVVSLSAQSSKEELSRLVANQDFDAAGKIVAEVAKSNQSDAETLLLCGKVYEELDKYHEAAEVYMLADKADGGEWETWVKIGAACSKDSNYTEASKWFNKALDKFSRRQKSEKFATNLEYADALILADSIKKAEKILVSARSRDDENSNVYLKLGNLYFAQKIYALAETNFKKALEYDEMNTPARINLAVSLYWLGNRAATNDLRVEYYKRCLQEWKVVSEQQPKNAKAWYMQGKILFFAGKYVASAIAFEEYIKLRPSDIEARWMLGKSYFEAGKCNEARENLEMVAKDATERQNEANLLLAQCFYEAKEFSQAVEKYNLIKDLNMADRRRLGTAYLKSGDSLSAYKTWLDAYNEDSEDLNNIQYLRLTALQMGSMKPKMRVEATEVIEKWLANPKAPQEDKSTMLYTAGQHYLLLDTLKNDTTNHALTYKAIDYLGKSIEINPDFPYAYMFLGDAYAKIDSTDKALEVFAAGIESAKQDTVKHKSAARSLYIKTCSIHMKAKDWKKLIEAANQWIEAQPKSEFAWLYLGFGQHSLQNYSEAKKAYRKTLEINPKNKTASKQLKAITDAGQ